MTDITQQTLLDWVADSGVRALFSEPALGMVLVGNPIAVNLLRRFAELARQEDDGFQRGLALASSICRHYAYGLHCPVSGSTPDAIDAVSACARLIDESRSRTTRSE